MSGEIVHTNAEWMGGVGHESVLYWPPGLEVLDLHSFHFCLTSEYFLPLLRVADQEPICEESGP